MPVQGDQINIPAEPMSGLPALGGFEITNVYHNGGGEVTLELKALKVAQMDRSPKTRPIG